MIDDAETQMLAEDGTADARERQEALSAFWDTVRRLPTYVRLIAALMSDPRVPHRVRVMVAAGGAYVVSPVDLIPGVIPVAGQLDDVYVALMATRQAMRMVPAHVAEEITWRYGIDESTIDGDLAAIRRLVRVGVTQGAAWILGQVNRLGTAVARRRSS